MTRRSIALLTAAGGAAILAGVSYAPQVLRAQQAQPPPVHQVPQAKDGGVVVMLCDGKTSMEVKGLKTGESMSHAQAVEITREQMAQSQREHPNEKWQMAQTDESSAPVPAPSEASGADVAKPGKAAGAKPPTTGQQQGDTYASFTDRDYKVWKNETDNFVAEGKRFSTATRNSAARSASAATCAIPTRRTPIPRLIQSTRSSYRRWRCCAT